MIAYFAWLALALPQEVSWPIGVEREVDTGVYMQVVSQQSGWRIWRIERRAGVSCQAVKSAKGRPHPIPVGVDSMMFRGTPFLTVSHPTKDFSYRWQAAHYGNVRVQYRLPGARFWEEGAERVFPAEEIGEREIELAVRSWEYPAIYEGLVEESAVFDLAGLDWARTQVLACEQAATEE